MTAILISRSRCSKYLTLTIDTQVFPIKNELLHPQEEMERHITDLIKKVCFSSHPREDVFFDFTFLVVVDVHKTQFKQYSSGLYVTIRNDIHGIRYSGKVCTGRYSVGTRCAVLIDKYVLQCPCKTAIHRALGRRNCRVYRMSREPSSRCSWTS